MVKIELSVAQLLLEDSVFFSNCTLNLFGIYQKVLWKKETISSMKHFIWHSEL